MPRRDSKSATPGQRRLRVGEAVRHELARIFLAGGFRDPALQDLNVTVTEVRLSPDLKQATAFVMPLAGRNAADTVAALRRGAPYLRGLLAQAMKLRHAPAISFELDASFEQASRIDALLRRDDVARDLAPEKDKDDA